MSSTITTTNRSSNNNQQPKTAKEIIAANVQSLIEQLEAGHSDALTAYLNAMSRFHNYKPRQHPRNRTAEARRHPCCGFVEVEGARPQRQERRERHPHSRSHHRRSPQEG